MSFKFNYCNEGGDPEKSKGGIILRAANESGPSVFNIECLMLKANLIQ